MSFSTNYALFMQTHQNGADAASPGTPQLKQFLVKEHTTFLL